MKKIIWMFIIFFSISFFNELFAYDTTAAGYFPLATGNVWSYHRIDRTGFNCIQITGEYDYLVRVVSDTAMSNGKRYFKLNGPSVDYLRIDSTTMNLYRFTGGSECLIDSLFARLNDFFTSCRQYISYPFRIIDTSNVYFSGSMRKTKGIRGLETIGHGYTLMYGMGLYYEHSCENGGAIISLNGCIINGVQYGTILGSEVYGNPVPSSFTLFQNYPNPFNPKTVIRFQVASDRFVTLKIFDALGKEVAALVRQQLKPGTFQADWDGTNYPSGVYYCQLSVGNEQFATKKMVLLK